MTLAEIKRSIYDTNESGLISDELQQALYSDPRSGVREILAKLERKRSLFLEEQKRQRELWLIERKLFSLGVDTVAGVDEVGRGPLAGPVMAAAVILPPEIAIDRLNDSKKLTSVARSSLAIRIRKLALYWSVGLATVEEIQKLNIYHASMLAMRRALEGLEIKPDHVLVDGYTIPNTNLAQTGVIGGDSKSASIAAASVLAKVARDDIMDQLNILYPQYGFNRHKGYGTREHLDALDKFGPCPHHRQGFAPVKDRLGMRLNL